MAGKGAGLCSFLAVPSDRSDCLRRHLHWRLYNNGSRLSRCERLLHFCPHEWYENERLPGLPVQYGGKYWHDFCHNHGGLHLQLFYHPLGLPMLPVEITKALNAHDAVVLIHSWLCI